MKKTLFLLGTLWLTVTTQVVAQTEAIATYVFESYGGFEIETTLRIKGNKSYYSHYQDNTELNTPEGYTFWHYKNYIDWYLDGENEVITEQRHPHQYPLLHTRHPEKIKWEILDEFDEIAGYKVQKAVTKPLKESDT